MVTTHRDPSVFMPDFVAALLPDSEEITKVYTKGLHSDAIILSNRVAVKVLEGGKRREHATPATALEMGQWIYSYFTQMRDLSLGLVPGFLHCAVLPALSPKVSEASLVVVSPYEGIDFEDAITTGAIEPRRALSVLLDAIRPVLDSADVNGRTRVGLDAKPANFCMGQHGKKVDRAVFIDFVPPRYRQENGVYLVDYPHPKDPDAYAHVFWKYYTPEGILSNLLAQMCRTTPDAWSTYLRSLLGWLRAEGKTLLRNWFLGLDDMLFDRQTLEGERNPLVLRLCACKLASQNSDFRRTLAEFFTNISRYEDGPIDRVCHTARAYLLQCVPSARSRKNRHPRTRALPAPEELLMTRCVTLLNNYPKIDLNSFRVFGDYVCWNPETKSRLIKLKDQVSRIINYHARRDRPASFLICAPSRSGKTFMVNELAKQFPDVYYSACKLSDHPTVEKACAVHLSDMIAHRQDKKPLIACLDEADTKVAGEHVYRKLLGILAGEPFPHPQKPKQKCVLTNVVWFFLVSSAETCREFETKLQGVDKSEKPIDFWRRFQPECRIDVPFDPRSPEERVIKGVSIIMYKARQYKMLLQHIDAKVLICLGMKTDNTPGQIELLVEESIAHMEEGSTIFRLEQLRLPDEEKMACLKRLAQHRDRATEWLIEIEP